MSIGCGNFVAVVGGICGQAEITVGQLAVGINLWLFLGSLGALGPKGLSPWVVVSVGIWPP